MQLKCAQPFPSVRTTGTGYGRIVGGRRQLSSGSLRLVPSVLATPQDGRFSHLSRSVAARGRHDAARRVHAATRVGRENLMGGLNQENTWDRKLAEKRRKG